MRTGMAMIICTVVLAWSLCLSVQVSDQPAAPKFKGLTLGSAAPEDVLRVLGQPKYGDPTKDESVMYPSSQSGQMDTLTFGGKPTTLILVEAATIPADVNTRGRIAAKLGQPEYQLRLGRQTMYEYAERGYRLWVDNSTGKTIGAVLFTPQGYPRVPVGEQRSVVVPALPAVSSGKPAVFMVGFASRYITPSQQSLAGLGFDKVHDPLSVRAIVIAAGGKTVALVAGDIFVYTSHEIEPIQQGARAAGIDYLLFASTHSHSAPDGIGLDGPRPDEYNAFVQRQAVACIQEAKGKLAPATIELAEVEMSLDGGHISTISRNWRDPGIVYPYLTVLRFMSAGPGEKPLGSLVQFTCHPERLAHYDNAISADYVAPLREVVEADLGGTCVFFNGPLGGMVSPDGLPGTDRFQDTLRIGQWIGHRAVEAVKAGCSPITKGKIEFRIRPLLIPMVSEKLRERMGPGRIHVDLIHGSHPTQVGLLDIGDLQILVVPGELLPDLAFRIRAHMTGKHAVIIGLANDEIGYIVPAWDFHVGSYEEQTGMGPSAAPQVVDAAGQLLAGTPGW